MRTWTNRRHRRVREAQEGRHTQVAEAGCCFIVGLFTAAQISFNSPGEHSVMCIRQAQHLFSDTYFIAMM
jgi:hypothetical protein